MGQKGILVKKAKTLRGDAVRWLDKNLQGKTFSQRYLDARKLFNVAGNARSKLEYALPKDIKLRGKLAKEREKLYTQYNDAISELTTDVEDALKQMKKLRGEFLASESAGQRVEYDEQMKKLKTRLDDLREYAKWVPADLKRREYRRADATINAALSPETVPKRRVPVTKVRKELREVASEMKDLKSKRAAAKSAAKKLTFARQINKLRAKRGRLQAKLEIPVETAVASKEEEMDFTKFASKAERKRFFAEQEKVIGATAVAKIMPNKKDREMVFTEADTEKFDRKQRNVAGKKEMLAALKEARVLTKEMAAKKKAGKSMAGVRRKRFEAFARYMELGGNPERVPKNILKAMIEEGRRMG